MKEMVLLGIDLSPDGIADIDDSEEGDMAAYNSNNHKAEQDVIAVGEAGADAEGAPDQKQFEAQGTSDTACIMVATNGLIKTIQKNVQSDDASPAQIHLQATGRNALGGRRLSHPMPVRTSSSSGRSPRRRPAHARSTRAWT